MLALRVTLAIVQYCILPNELIGMHHKLMIGVIMSGALSGDLYEVWRDISVFIIIIAAGRGEPVEYRNWTGRNRFPLSSADPH